MPGSAGLRRHAEASGWRQSPERRQAERQRLAARGDHRALMQQVIVAGGGPRNRCSEMSRMTPSAPAGWVPNSQLVRSTKTASVTFEASARHSALSHSPGPDTIHAATIPLTENRIMLKTADAIPRFSKLTPASSAAIIVPGAIESHGTAHKPSKPTIAAVRAGILRKMSRGMPMVTPILKAVTDSAKGVIPCTISKTVPKPVPEGALIQLAKSAWAPAWRGVSRHEQACADDEQNLCHQRYPVEHLAAHLQTGHRGHVNRRDNRRYHAQ